MKKIKGEGLLERDNLDIIITKKGNSLKDTFGILTFKKSTQEILDESDKECWDE